MKRSVAFLTAVLYRDFVAYSTGELKKLGVSYGQLPFLMYLNKHPGCAPAELTSRLHLDWGYSQRSITRLVESGFLIKKRSGAEARTYQLFLTEKGEKALAGIHAVVESWDERKAKRLQQEEQEQLITLLYKLMVPYEGIEDN